MYVDTNRKSINGWMDRWDGWTGVTLYIDLYHAYIHMAGTNLGQPTSSTFIAQVREAPDISQTHSIAKAGQKEV